MRILIGFAIFLCASVAHGSLTINPDAVKHATVFIFAAGADGQVDSQKSLGTGFLVQIPLKNSDRVYYVLMTARHIFNPSWAGCDEPDPDNVFVRMNLKTYDAAKDLSGVGYVKLALRGPDSSALYHTPEDDEVDAAAIVLNTNDFSQTKYDIVPVPVMVFATDEELGKLSTGDEIVSAGLLPGAQGELRNYPIFKFGFISDERPEPFKMTCGSTSPPRTEKVWFISINMFPGASGSAVFYAPPGAGSVQFGAPVMRPILIGIQSSSVPTADVAAMTPISLAFKMLQSLPLPNADFTRGGADVTPHGTVIQ